MKVRRRAVAADERRSSVRTAWMGLITLAIIGLGASTCGSVDEVLVPCSNADDCRAHPGTVCLNQMCVCNGTDVAFCDGVCKPIAQCGQGSGGVGGGAGGAAGACTTADDCEQPGDYRCGRATCLGGVCGLDVKPFGPTESQVAGDCMLRLCDGQGDLVELPEASDFYNDGLPCTVESCAAGKPVSSLVPDSDVCPGKDTGVCFEGECVPCINDIVPCPGEPVCSYIYCVPVHCTNLKWDPGSGETDIDCGGPCRPCFLGYTCAVDSDCLSEVCTQGACQAPTCSDGVQNDKETGIDCGGPTDCPLCPSGQGCRLRSDCQSGVCWEGLCQAPSCTDGWMNGDENGEDCGGPCVPCP
jgi:hypothetical protein